VVVLAPVDMWDILNAIFYILCEGCRWRALPGDFPAWPTVYTYFRSGRRHLGKDTTICEWVRVEQGRQPRPSEAIIDFHCVKSAAVSECSGFDGGKLSKGRKRFLTVDTLGLVLRVFVLQAWGSVKGRSES